MDRITTSGDPDSPHIPFSKLPVLLFNWYKKNARQLSWRNVGNPYFVWVSEIMLQQTTTQTVENYFNRFIAAFPTIRELAAAPLETVQRYWEGLGYYRRCSQMHRAAGIIAEKYGGEFPSDYATVIQLPGIGRYTAGAILSIAFDKRLPILEANTQRLYIRLSAKEQRPQQNETSQLWDFAESILPKKRCGEFNQALMDLGALVCTPKEPKCADCPICVFCGAFHQGRQNEIPLPKHRLKAVQRTEAAVIVKNAAGQFLMIRYPEGVRWAGLWDFPRVAVNIDLPLELFCDTAIADDLSAIAGERIVPDKLLTTMKHSVTKYRITLYVLSGTLKNGICSIDENDTQHRWLTADEIQHLPLNATARKIAAGYLARMF